jgi:H+-transporting ATPase
LGLSRKCRGLFNREFAICVTRRGQTWPSWQLVGAMLGVDVLATLFRMLGVMNTTSHDQFCNSSNDWTDIVTVVVVYAYSIGVIIFIAIVYIALNGLQWVHDLGRKDRNNKVSYIENIIGHINKLARKSVLFTSRCLSHPWR